MLFRRRTKLSWPQRVRAFFWPRKGPMRPFRYLVKRILRVSASPHQVAAGVAAGTFSAFTPFLGLHILLAVALAYLLAGNLLVAVLSTAIANPLTMPLIAVFTFRVGEVLLGTGTGETVSAAELFHMLEHLELAELWQPVLKPMLTGTGVVGLAAGVIAYCGTRFAVRTVHARRRARLIDRAGLHHAESSALNHGEVSP